MYIDIIQSDTSYFTEQEEAKEIVDRISDLSSSLLYKNDKSDDNKKDMLHELISKITKLTEIISKYMNVEVLLYQYIELLIGDIFEIIKRFTDLPYKDKLEIVTRNENEKTISLLVLENLSYYLYIISKSVGVRRVLNHAPNDVSLFEKITETIEMIQDANKGKKDGSSGLYEDRLWCMEFVFLCWQSLLVYTPFELNTIWKDESEEKITFQERILKSSMHYLKKSTKVRDGAAMVISNLFSRKDVLNSEDFKYFLNFCRKVLTNSFIPELENSAKKEFLNVTNDPEEVNNHLSIGVLAVLKQILKRMPSTDLNEHLEQIEYCLLSCEDVIVNSATRKIRAACLGRLATHLLPQTNKSQKYPRKYRNIGVMGNQEGENEDESYQEEESEMDFDTERVEAILAKIMETLVDKDIRVRWASAKSIGRISSRLPVELIEEILDHIINSINSQFNRTSEISQGIGNSGMEEVSGRFKDLNLSVQPLTVKSECIVHGGCLAIAEILRNGLIHPNMLEKVLDATILSLSFEFWRGKGSAGTSVRDASCFICWALGRNFNKEILGFDHISRISKELVNVSLFDASVNCRRAACSALQELVGRIGTVPKGLELIQMCNYYTVSNRNKAFVEVSRNVSTLGYYTNSMLQNIITTKLFHPDLSTRELASLAIYKIISSTSHLTASHKNDSGEVVAGLLEGESESKKEEEKKEGLECLINYLIEYFLGNLNSGSTATIHGSLRALARLVALATERELSTKQFFSKVVIVPVTFEKKRMFRGKGSNFTRHAICKLIEVNCKLIMHTNPRILYEEDRYFDIHKDLLDVYTVILKDCMRNFAIEVQLASVEALEKLFLVLEETKKSSELLTFLFNSLSSKGDHIAARRGYALAFSSVPLSQYRNEVHFGNINSQEEEMGTQKVELIDRDHKNVINKIIKLLCNEIKTNCEFEAVRDPKTRQFSLLSILSILSRLEGYVLDKEVLKEITETMTVCCNDYEIDMRGDVGSWVRELSSEVIAYILQQYLFQNTENNGETRKKNTFKNLDKEMTTELTKGLARLGLENLDHVRSRSTFLFAHLFTNKLQNLNFKWIWNRIFYNVPYEYLIHETTLNMTSVNTTTTTATNNTTPSTVATIEDSADDMDETVDREIEQYIKKVNEIKMYVKIDNKLLEGFNMLYDISKSLINSVSQYQETELQSGDTNSLTPTPTPFDGNGEETPGRNQETEERFPEELLEYSLMGSEKISVVLRVPGWSAAPVTFRTFLWVLLIPSYSLVAFKSIVKIMGQNSRMEVKLHSKKKVIVLEDVLVEFISQNKDTLIGWNNKPKTLEQALNECSLDIYRESIRSKDPKTSSKLVNTLTILFSHKLLQVEEWSELIDMMVEEGKTSSNYSYIKSIIRCFQVLLTYDWKSLSPNVVETVLWFLSHQYPTIRSYVASNLSMALSSMDNSDQAIEILDSCEFHLESMENIECTVKRLREALKI